MARVGPMDVTDGYKIYHFVVYDLEGPIYNAPGVYIFSKCTPNTQGGNNHEFLYIGETQGFKERLNPNHEKWKEALDLGMNYIAVHVPFPLDLRFDIERNLIQHLKPPLNDQIMYDKIHNYS